MELQKSDRFFPNECFICHWTIKISRCARCNMIAYCDKHCQSKHWPQHRTFCKAVSQILEKKKITHIYETLANQSHLTWLSKRNKVIDDVARQLNRFPNLHELSLLKFPRVCFVCKEAKQEKLKNCPNCTAVSFCDLHPNSEMHERNCQIMQNRVDIICQKLNSDPYNKLTAIGVGTKILKTDDEPPTSLKQFLDHYTKPECDISEIEKIFISELFSASLTIFQSLQMIYHGNYPSKIIIHITIGTYWLPLITFERYWEGLLHLLPDVKCLKIIFIYTKMTLTKESPLCKDCKSKKRKLLLEANSYQYGTYLAQRNYQKPSLIAAFNLSLENSFFRPFIPPDVLVNIRQEWLRNIEKMIKICPILFTTLNQEEFITAEKNLLDSAINLDIIYRGFNNFAPLTYQDEPDTDTFIRNSQFMIVFQQRNDSHKSKSLARNCPQLCFYPQICKVCQNPDAKIMCKRCRIISYCSDEHRNQDQAHHKDICRVILILLTEMGTANLFQNAKTMDPDLWLQRKIDLLKKVQTKLDRNLEEYEKQMFLFPKACAICHDSDSSLLRHCECKVWLCKIHYNDANHKKFCQELSIGYKLNTNEHEQRINSVFSPDKYSRQKLPSSMVEFINSYMSLVTDPNQLETIFSDEFYHQYLMKMTSKNISAPLTLRHFIKKFNSLITTTIHIIATKSDLVAEKSWIIFLYTLKRLKELKIVFVGPEVMNYPETIIDTSDCHFLDVKKLKTEYHAMKYDDYFKSEKFIKPDIIFGCNLNIHEDELFAESGNNSWREIILTVEKVGVPFILTSGTKARVEKEHKTICDLLGKSVNFDFIEENPFASLLPERDFETEGVMYANKFAIAYNGKYRIPLNSTKEKEETDVNYDNSQIETKFKRAEENNSETHESTSEVKEIINEIETKKIKIDSENSNENKIEKSDSSLQRIKFLVEENENLKEQLNSANAQIDQQKNLILNLRTIYADFVDKNPISEFEKVYNHFVENVEKSINNE